MTLELAISQILFYVFAFLALVGAIGVISFRNPVSSAMSMALCFLSVAAVYFNMGAEFMGIVQIIVYAGAILVLFLFVVMMLDVKEEEKRRPCLCTALIGTVVAGIFAGLIVNISLALPGAKSQPCPGAYIWQSIMCTISEAPSPEQSCPCCCDAAATPSAQYGAKLPEIAESDKGDIAHFGETLYSNFNIQIVILSFALLAASVGSIAISRKIRKD